MARRQKTQRNQSERSSEEIGKRLAVTRQVLGLLQGRIIHQNEFSQKAGLTPSQYNQYETGSKRPSLESAHLLADAYSLTLDWIFRGDPSGLRYDIAEAIKAIRQAQWRPKA